MWKEKIDDNGEKVFEYDSNALLKGRYLYNQKKIIYPLVPWNPLCSLRNLWGFALRKTVENMNGCFFTVTYLSWYVNLHIGFNLHTCARDFVLLTSHSFFFCPRLSSFFLPFPFFLCSFSLSILLCANRQMIWRKSPFFFYLSLLFLYKFSVGNMQWRALARTNWSFSVYPKIHSALCYRKRSSSRSLARRFCLLAVLFEV